LATSTSKCTCEDDIDGVDKVKMAVDQVKAGARGLGDRVVEDKRRHTSRLWRRHRGYVPPVGFGGFCLKTASGWFVWFGPQNLGKDLAVAYDIIEELASRQSYFMKGLWLSDARNSTWTISPLWSSGLGKISRSNLGMCNIFINKDRDCQKQSYLPSRSLAQANQRFSLFMESTVERGDYLLWHVFVNLFSLKSIKLIFGLLNRSCPFSLLSPIWWFSLHFL
jgi:hypothetical protein